MKKIYIPSNLNMSNELNHASYKEDQNEIDKFHYFIHLIYEQRILYRFKEEYVPLKALYLRRIINEHFERYRGILIDKKIIDCDYHYIKGKKSYGYKLLPPYSEVKHREVELKNPNILKNIENWKQRRIPTTDVCLHLYKFLEQVKIDEEVLNYLESFEQTNQEYTCNKMSIDKFINKDFFIYKDQWGERIHTNITSLKSTFRKFLTYKGLKLFNIDIVNSQPLFLLLTPPIHSSIRCAPSDMINMDIFDYKSWVENGILYDRLMVEYGIEDRQEFKEKFFANTFFGKGVSKKFWDTFPSIAKILTEIKKKDYRSVAWMMQRAESNLMINVICRRIMEEHPDVFIATIHDSILTTEEHVTKIKSIISEEFKNKGLLPAIRIEPA